MSIDTFSVFPKLPPEIRLRIWSFAAPPSRIVELTWNSKARSIVSRTRAPAILHACLEARTELIKSYKKLQFTDCSQNILVDFENDTLFFGAGCKCMVPSGKSRPWIMQNRKLIRDITNSKCLRENVSTVAFDCAFLLGMDKVYYDFSAVGMIGCLSSIERVILVKDVTNRSERCVRDGVGMVLKQGVRDETQRQCATMLSAFEVLMVVIDACEFVAEK